MENILIVDVETSGVNPAVDHVVEIAAVLWSVRWRCLVSAWSDLVQQPSNAAEVVNKIKVGSLAAGLPIAAAIGRLRRFVERADVLVAHNVRFDASFLPRDLGRPWVCSCWEIEWPAAKTGESLVKLALAHDVPVTGAHRALTDCLLLARVFENAAAHFGMDVEKAFVRAARPMGEFQALVVYDDRDKAKAAGFSWDSVAKRWTRRMAVEDVAALPFDVHRLDGGKS